MKKYPPRGVGMESCRRIYQNLAVGTVDREGGRLGAFRIGIDEYDLPIPRRAAIVYSLEGLTARERPHTDLGDPSIKADGFQ